MARISVCLWTAVVVFLLCTERSLCATRKAIEARSKSNVGTRGGIRANLYELKGSDLACSDELDFDSKKDGRARGKLLDHDFGEQSSRHCGTNLSSEFVYGPGNYLMQISLGTPPQKFTVVLDTTSDLVWVQCKPCVQCSDSTQSIFEPSESSSNVNVSCSDSLCADLLTKGCADEQCLNQFRNDEDQLLAQGQFSQDTLSLMESSSTSLKVESFAFGCSDQNMGLQLLQVDGVAGFGRGPISLVSQVGSVYGNKYSYCLRKSVPNTGLFNNVGPSTLFLGDMAIPPKQVGTRNKKIMWSPLLKYAAHPSFYLLNLQGISINNKKLKIPGDSFKVDKQGNRGTLINIGVKITKFSQAIFDALTQAMDALIDYPKALEPYSKYKFCYTVARTDIPNFPTLSLHFQGGANVVLLGDKTFVEVLFTSGVNNGKVLCFAVDSTAEDINVLGSVWQQGIRVIVDNEVNKVGFVYGDCTAPTQ